MITVDCILDLLSTYHEQRNVLFFARTAFAACKFTRSHFFWQYC